MPRPPDIIRPTSIHSSIPEDLRAWLTLHLWSATEQRVPQGAIQKLILKLLREYVAKVDKAADAVPEVSEPDGTT